MPKFLTTRKIAIATVALAVILGVAFWKFGPSLMQKTPEKKEASLLVWGLWEDQGLIRPAIEAYKKIKPEVSVNYVLQNPKLYRSRVQTQISENQGPDLFLIHNSWTPVFLKSNSLAPMPDVVMTADEYSKTFYPVVKDSFLKGNKVYAFPKGIDGLALYYNEDILKAAGVVVPKDWEQFVTAAIKTTVVGQDGKIQTAGAAMGSPSNVDFWPDIIGMLFFQQPGASLENPGTLEGAEVIKFFTEFTTDSRKRVWSQDMSPSTEAFASGKVAFMFAPSWRAFDIRVANPNLNFKIAPVPQLPGRNIGWATFWGYAVSRTSQNQAEAWEFAKFLSSPEIQKLLYQEASKIRLFGLPYSRTDMQKDLIPDPLVGAFITQGPIYKTWYLSSRTFDQAVDDEMIKYFEDALNATLAGQSPLTALQNVSPGISQVLDKYGAR